MSNKVNDKTKEIQLSFFRRVKSSAPSNLSFVDELADLLGVSNDSAYRRMRSETPLTIDEIATICSHFKVPFDTEVQNDTSLVTFNFLELYNTSNSFIKWVDNLHNDVAYISNVHNGEIIYAADDVPIWHHYMDDEFIAFKYFYWLKCILNDINYIDKKFDPNLIDPVLIDKAKSILGNYNKVNSIEIWTEDTFNSTLKQVEYFWESGFFNNKDQALAMCQYIHRIIDALQLKAANGNKQFDSSPSASENFKLYVSDVMIGNNSILVTLGENKIAYVSNNTFNFLSTSNKSFVAENELWLRNLIKKSTLISGVSEKLRNRFFRSLHDKVDAAIARIG